jgi:hypothetical protein
LQELKLFLENINEGSIIFRSNHVSNNLALAGTLPKDKQSLIDQINQVIKITPEDEMMEDVGML